ncbi:hypothetical protein [Gordonia sp. FQ]|uniref:hypothetical protein n=1 Tax=Gordonia sp. FQ TaxID=3446634 RepID=UPI003F83BF6C
MPSDPRELDILLADYEMLREDERSFVAHLVQAFAIAIAIVALLGGLVAKEFLESDSGDVLARIPDGALIAAPLLPLTLFVYLLSLGPSTILRAYYGRHLERRIRELVQQSTPPMPSLFELTVGVNRLSRGASAVRLLLGFMMVLVLIVFCTIALLMLLNVENLALKLMVIPFYVFVVTVLVWETVRLNTRGRELFEKQVQQLRIDSADSLKPREKLEGRGIVSYLILPRPGDIAKWLFFPAGAAIAILSGSSSAPLWRILVMMVILELLLYSARYQINDIRGISEDIKSPQAQLRGRLPVRNWRGEDSQETAIWSSLAVVGLRVYLAFALATIFGADMIRWTAIAAAAILISAGLYEGLRGIERLTYVRSPNALQLHPKARNAGWALIYFVGAGYAIRIVLGLCAVPSPIGALQFVLFGGYAHFLGIVFVSMTWALEGVSFLSKRPVSSIPPVYSQTVLEKPHLLLLSRSLPWRTGRRYALTPISAAPAASSLQGFIDPVPRAAKMLEPRRWKWMQLFSAWSLSAAAAGACAGALLTFSWAPESWEPWLIGPASGAACSLLVFPYLIRRIIPATLISLIIFAGIQVSLALSYAQHSLNRLEWTLVASGITGWVTLTAVTVMFLPMTYEKIVTFVPQIAAAARTIATRACALLIGHSATATIIPSEPDKEMPSAKGWPNG